jgi:ankyrin repeat protein
MGKRRSPQIIIHVSAILLTLFLCFSFLLSLSSLFFVLLSIAVILLLLTRTLVLGNNTNGVSFGSIREAIVSGVNVDLRSSDYGMTALHYVANGGYVPCAKLLIDEGGADLNLKDNVRGYTCI